MSQAIIICSLKFVMSVCGGVRCSGTWRGIDSINQYYRGNVLKALHPAAGSGMERQLYRREHGMSERDRWGF